MGKRKYQTYTPRYFFFKKIKYVDFNIIHNLHEDLWLMSSCTHNIISNVTFRW